MVNIAAEWSPYGLEPLRARSIKQRRYAALGAVVGLLLLWASLSDSVVTTDTDISTLGGGRNTIDITRPQQEQRSGPDAVVQVSPGRIVRSDAGDAPPEAAGAQTRAPPFEVEPVNWPGYAARAIPLLVIGGILWAGFRGRPGKGDEVNYGIYKGAMPIEMITASHAHLVVTSKEARGSLFGRRREDHIPRSAFLERAGHDEAKAAPEEASG